MTQQWAIINPNDPTDIMLITDDYGLCITLRREIGLNYKEIEKCACCNGSGVTIKEVK